MLPPEERKPAWRAACLASGAKYREDVQKKGAAAKLLAREGLA